MGSSKALSTTYPCIIQLLLFFLSSFRQPLYINVQAWASLENSFEILL